MHTLQELLEAIQNYNLSTLDNILDAKPCFLNKIDEDNSSLLHWIAGDEDNEYEYGDEDEDEDINDPKGIIDHLLNNYKIDINQTNQQGATALHIATTHEKIGVIKSLLQNNAKITPNKDGFTALHLAAIRNYTPIAKILIKNGAEPYAKNNEGDTPAHLAASENENASTFNFLLSQVDNPNALLLKENDKQETPFSFAIARDEFSIDEKKHYIKIALLANDTPEMPVAVSENSALLNTWHTCQTEISMLKTKKISETFTFWDLAKTIDLDALPKTIIEKINIDHLIATTINFPNYNDLLTANINHLKFIQNFSHQKIADSVYSFYDIYHEKNEHQLAIIFSNQKINDAVSTYLDNIDTISEIPSLYKEKIKNSFENHRLIGVERHCSVNTLVGYINRDPEKGGPLPNEIKKEILCYLPTEQLKQNSTIIIDSDTIPPPPAGTSHHYTSRLLPPFFNQLCASNAEMTHSEAEEATSRKANVNRLARLSLFATPSADADESKKEKEKAKLPKPSFAS